MPVTEDDNMDSSISQSNSYRYSALSKAEQRKNNKPIMEKRRRARINHCLNELKTLILDATNKDPARHTKLEKADILEMTVKHLQMIQQQQLSLAVASDPTVIHKFKNGFHECATEVSRYIGNLDGVENGVRQRLICHLNSYVSGLQSSSPTSPFSSPPTQNVPIANSNDNNNNNGLNHQLDRVAAQLHFIPSRLPTGELALLLPNSSSLSTIFSNDSNNGARVSAFTAVSKDSKLESKDLQEEICSSQSFPSPQSEVSSTSNEGMFKIPNLVRKSNDSLLMPVPNRNLKHPITLFKDNNPSLLKPLTIYTDPEDVISSQYFNESNSRIKSPLDYSFKKEITATRKRPLEDISSNTISSHSSTKIAKYSDDKCNKAEDLSNKSASVTEQEGNNTVDSMWRPW